jgi:hypothetical protein
MRRKRSAKEPPAAPLPGARSKASSLQADTGTGHAADAQGSPCPDQEQPDGRSPARGRAGGVQRDAAGSIAWGLPSAGQPRPARKNPRRAVHPAQRGTRRRGRAIQLDGRSPAQGRAGGVRPVLQVTAAGRGTDQAPGQGASCRTDRYHLRPRAQRVQVVRPCLHHLAALVAELRSVVGAAECVGDGVG